jgi:DNA replication protein DnaC
MNGIQDHLRAAAGLPPDAELPQAQIDRSDGRGPPPQPVSDEFKCPICHDMGFVGKNVPYGHPDWGKVFPCQCNQPDPEEITRILAKLSRLPLPTRERCRFRTWRSVPQLVAAEKAARRFAEGQAEHPFLTFAGPPGTGKTHLALAIGWEWVEQRRGTVIYWRVEDLLDALRAGYDRDNNTATPDTYLTLHAVTNCDLLILDDLGETGQTQWADRKLDQLIDARYINRRRTVTTTNATDEELPERLADRLHEGKVYALNAPSARRQQ